MVLWAAAGGSPDQTASVSDSSVLKPPAAARAASRRRWRRSNVSTDPSGAIARADPRTSTRTGGSVATALGERSGTVRGRRSARWSP